MSCLGCMTAVKAARFFVCRSACDKSYSPGPGRRLSRARFFASTSARPSGRLAKSGRGGSIGCRAACCGIRGAAAQAPARAETLPHVQTPVQAVRLQAAAQAKPRQVRPRTGCCR